MSTAAAGAHVRLRLSSRAENAIAVRQALGGFADATGLSASADLSDIGIAVTEACNNVSAHAYEGEDGPLEIEMLTREAEVVVTVRDWGVGMALDAGAPVEFPSDVDGELAGIGVPSIKALATTARWNEPAGGGTELEMIFSTDALAWEGSGPGEELTGPFGGDLSTPVRAIEVGMAPASVARCVLPRLLRVMAARAQFSIDRHADVQRVASVVLGAGASSWITRGARALLMAGYDSLEVAIGPMSEEDVSRLAVAVGSVEPNLSISMEPPDGRPRRLALRLERSPLEARSARAPATAATDMATIEHQLFSDLRPAERRLQAILENLAEAITVVDDTGRTVFANQAAIGFLGLDSAEELTQAKPGEIMSRFIVRGESGEELALELDAGRRLFRGEAAPPLLVRNVVRATGEERWIVVRASPIADPHSGRVVYAANVFEDVTQVKRAQLAEAFMAQASRVLASSMDYAETLQQIARLAAGDLADWCAVDVLGERGQIERVAQHHSDPEKLALAEQLDRGYKPALDDPIGVPEVIRSGQARIFNDISAEELERYARDAEHLRLLDGMGARDVIIVPLAAPSRTLGAITLVSCRDGRRLDDADLAVAVSLGQRAGTAVESARLYTERSRIARILQRALLPDSLPEMPGFEVAARYRPAGELNEVGGDFYDVFPYRRRPVVAGDRRRLRQRGRGGQPDGAGPSHAARRGAARHACDGDARAAARHAPLPGTRWPDVHRLPRGGRPAGRTSAAHGCAAAGRPRRPSAAPDRRPGGQGEGRRRAGHAPGDGRPDRRERGPRRAG